MQKILKVAQREYLESVKAKTFLISLLFTPAIILGVIYFTGKMPHSKAGPRPAVKVAVTDLSAQFAEEIPKSFAKHNESNPQRQINLQELQTDQSGSSVEELGKARLRSGGIDAYLVLDKDIIAGGGKVHLYTYKPKPADMDALWTVEKIINGLVVEQRCRQQNISPQILAKIRNVPIERIELGADKGREQKQSEAERVTRMMIPFAFMLLIYMGIMGIGQQILSSVIEEKSSRIIEVLLSAISPFELMAGKILGTAAVGLTVVGLWAAGAYGAAQWQGVNIDITAGLLFYFILYYVLGFLFFSALLAGIGSVCNNIKETQSLMMPLVLVFMIPMLSWFKLVQSPDGTLARVLSFVPPITPLVMILRLSSGAEVPAGEIIATIVLLSGCVLVAIWLAAKIFRTGILMYGKRPGFRQVLHWLRQN